MMEVVVTTGAMRYVKHQTNRRHQQTNTQLCTGQMLNAGWVLTFGCPSRQPTTSGKALKEEIAGNVCQAGKKRSAKCSGDSSLLKHIFCSSVCKRLLSAMAGNYSMVSGTRDPAGQQVVLHCGRRLEPGLHLRRNGCWHFLRFLRSLFGHSLAGRQSMSEISHLN